MHLRYFIMSKNSRALCFTWYFFLPEIPIVQFSRLTSLLVKCQKSNNQVEERPQAQVLKNKNITKLYKKNKIKNNQVEERGQP